MTVLDSISLIHTLEDSLSVVGLKSASCKLRAVCEMHNMKNLKKMDNVAKVVMTTVKRLRKGEVENIGMGWLGAAAKGESGEECWKEYPCEGEGNRVSEVR